MWGSVGRRPAAWCAVCLACAIAAVAGALSILAPDYSAVGVYPHAAAQRRQEVAHQPESFPGVASAGPATLDSDVTEHDVARTTAMYRAWCHDEASHLVPAPWVRAAATRSWYVDALGAGRPARPFLFDFVDQEGRQATLQWCSIPKNSCTLWQMFFARLGGCAEWPLERTQRNRPCSHGDSPWYYQIGDAGPVPPRGSTSGTDVSVEANLAEAQLFGARDSVGGAEVVSTRFALVRNPLLRTLSAYLDKGCVSLPSKDVPHSAQPYLAMNFTSFGDFVTREFAPASSEPFTHRDCGHGGRLWGVNQHWRPQLCSCAFALGAPYDIVAHVENPDAALLALEEKARLPRAVVHDGWGDAKNSSFYAEMTLSHPRGVEDSHATHLTHANDKSMLFFTTYLVDVLVGALGHEINMLGYAHDVAQLRRRVAACEGSHCGSFAWRRMGKSAINAVCEPTQSE